MTMKEKTAALRDTFRKASWEIGLMTVDKLVFIGALASLVVERLEGGDSFFAPLGIALLALLFHQISKSQRDAQLKQRPLATADTPKLSFFRAAHDAVWSKKSYLVSVIIGCASLAVCAARAKNAYYGDALLFGSLTLLYGNNVARGAVDRIRAAQNKIDLKPVP
jgi:hypothetical protein